MNNVSFNPSMYKGRNNVSFQGTEQAFSKAQRFSKTLVRESFKLGTAAAVVLTHPDPIQGACFGAAIKGFCDCIGVAVELSKQEKKVPTYMSELNVFKISGKVVTFLSDKLIPTVKNWV